MSRSFKTILLIIALIPCLSPAKATNFFVCRWNCFFGDYPPHVHNFHPRLQDGAPVVDNYQYDPEGYHGVGCVWSWQPVATANGPAWALVPTCLQY
jgi:hypothetical protein